jgi:hypothetical protein
MPISVKQRVSSSLLKQPWLLRSDGLIFNLKSCILCILLSRIYTL